MEIQAQTQIPLTSSGSSSTTASTTSGSLGAGTSNSLNGQATGGFSSTLNGLLTGSASAGNALSNQAASTGLNVLVQLLGAVNNESVLSNEEIKGSAQQLDALIKLLGSDSEDVTDLLDNPDVQSWLAGLQAIMLLQPLAVADQTQLQPTVSEDDSSVVSELIEVSNNPTADNELNPLLFVPIEASNATNEASDTKAGITHKVIAKEEAVKLLESFNQLLQVNGDKAASPQVEKVVQAALNDLQKLMATVVQQPTAAQVNTTIMTEQAVSIDSKAPIVTEKPTARVVGNLAAGVRTSSHKGSKVEETVPVLLPTANSKLEFLAAKSIQPKLIVDSNGSESPLFEPLVDLPNDSSNETPAIPMHEFLKHVQNTQAVTKPPVILMQAPNFVEEMTQLVVKSFTLETKQDGFTEAKLSLYPQNLGQVDVRLTMHNGQLIAQFMADSSLGKEMLESQLSQLRTTLQSQGIQVEKLEVSQNQAFQSGMFQEQQRHQQSQQSSKQQKGNSVDSITSVDDEALQTQLNTSPTANGSGSTSIDITA
ncbi:flagellar hook-length control protein FliK [Paenibacillus periandrae]|uniref:flagellar hook-length control protein FliK n=1 Tax=Paenibacillus periandrae TaxID=1761741 RepID=UPI001F09A3BD|nr:flagellar hook-length control protein FliK [Paenibacillus periandrae]